MELKLDRPLLFFDIESTGLNIASDAIIELSFVKVFPNGEERIKTWRVKPWDYVNNTQMPINPSAEEVHGIKDEDLKECPTFYEIAEDLVEWLKDSDLAGFNSTKFDLPLLAEELERVRRYKNKEFDLNLHKTKMVDVQNIFHAMEPRNLKAAYRFYCDKELENAHSAEADTTATYEILKAQIARYPETLKNDVDFLSKFSTRFRTVDYAGRIVLNDKDEPVISFGKHRGKTAREVYFSEPSYFAWIDQGDFTLDTKREFSRLKEEFEAEKRADKIAKNKPLGAQEIKNQASNLASSLGGTVKISKKKESEEPNLFNQE